MSDDLSLKEWRLLMAVSVGALGAETAPGLPSLIERGYVRRSPEGLSVAEPGLAFLRDVTEFAVRTSALLLANRRRAG